MAVSGTSYLYGLWPPMAEAVRYLLAWCSYYKLEGNIVSGLRSLADQATRYAVGRTPDEIRRQVSKRIGIDVDTNAPPGRSAHNFGLAIDVEGRDQANILSLAKAIGFELVAGDDSHIQWPGWRALVGL